MKAKYFLPLERPPSHSAEAFPCSSLVAFYTYIEQLHIIVTTTR